MALDELKKLQSGARGQFATQDVNAFVSEGLNGNLNALSADLDRQAAAATTHNARRGLRPDDTNANLPHSPGAAGAGEAPTDGGLMGEGVGATPQERIENLHGRI